MSLIKEPGGIFRLRPAKQSSKNSKKNFTEVYDLDLRVTPLLEHHILRFDVQMDDVERVEMLEAEEDLPDEGGCLGLVETLLGTDVVEQFSTGHPILLELILIEDSPLQFEDEDNISRGFVDFVELYHIGVAADCLQDGDLQYRC